MTGEKITVKTAQLGGISRVVNEFTFSAGNMVKAWYCRENTQKKNVTNYGNIGCGKTWIEIDGTIIDPNFFSEFGVCNKKTVEDALKLYSIDEVKMID